MSVRKTISLKGSDPKLIKPSDLDWGAFLDIIYPVGSIYFTTTKTTATAVQNALRGGTWVQWGKGRVPVGMGSNGTTNYSSVEATGGSEKVTLNISQIPSHTHAQRARGSQGDIAAAGSSIGAEFLGTSSTSIGSTFATGGGGSHENRQPYITVYMWKRTS